MLVSSLAALLLPALALAAPAKRTYGHEEKVEESHHDDHHDDDHKLISAFPFEFTSTFSAKLSPDFIINANQTSVPGLAGGYGMAKFGINAVDDLICFHIEAYISGNYSSPARTATHIHEAPFGRSGPPRLAFPNPTGDSPINEFGRRVSAGCMMGPFTTGIIANGADTGTGFTLAQIEANPPAFFADTHTAEFTAGAIRGQLELVESSY